METSSFRIKVFFILMILFFIGVFLRLVQFQVFKGEKLHRISTSRPITRDRIEAPRGKILDRNGKVLAESKPYFVLEVLPAQVRHKEKAIKTLSYLLNWTEDEVLKKWTADKQRLPGEPILIAEKLDRDAVAKIRGKISQLLTLPDQTKYDQSGIVFGITYERFYPYGNLGGHLLGYLKKPNLAQREAWEKKDPGRLGANAQVGVVGVEKKFDHLLRGYDGFHFAFVDAQGREIDPDELGISVDIEDVSVKPGQDIRLTVDIDLMKLAAKEFARRAGALVALNPQNGEILALVSEPSYDPKQLSGSLSHKVWKGLQEHPDNILVHRAIQAAYPPGSTYKIVTAIAGLADNKIKVNERINCPGYYQHGNRRWGCWNRSGHGAVNLHQALKHSCDVYFYKMGERITGDRMAYYARLLGLGKKTGVLDLNEERSGLVPDTEWKKKYRHQDWKSTDDLLTAIGQGANLVTPLQNALMVAHFSNGAKKIQPHLLKSYQNQEGKVQLVETPSLEAIDWKLNSKQYLQIHNALVAVVEDADGTGKRAQVEGVKVGGKTGTAQVVSLDRKGKVAGKSGDHAWFVAFAPSEDPQIALAVLVEHGGGGGAIAAPIAQRVLQKYFKDYAP